MLQFLKALQSSMLVKVAGLFFLVLLLCIPLAEIEPYRPPRDAEGARDQRRAQLIQRVLRPVEKDLEETASQAAKG